LAGVLWLAGADLFSNTLIFDSVLLYQAELANEFVYVLITGLLLHALLLYMTTHDAKAKYI
jgi:hypothetical protein